MAKLQIIILSLLPLCLGQFSIQGPSDGNRRAQGLKYSADKGVEYTDQAASLGTGGFSIQGASDGNSDFQIQGATDGNSDFRIQGATDGNQDFQIHGPTDGGSQAYLQNFDDHQAEPQPSVGQGRAIEYKDPSGQRVNWRSYNRAASKAPVQQQQQQQQYEEPVQRPLRRRPPQRQSHQPARAQVQQQPQQQQQVAPRYQHAPILNINYNPIEKAPPSIQEILQYQAQIPYENIIPEHLRLDALSSAQEQAKKFAEEYPKQVLAQQPPQLIIEEAPRSQYRTKPRQQQAARERRQAPEYLAYHRQESHQPQESSRYQQQQRRQVPQHDQYQQQLQQQRAYLEQEPQQQQQQQYAAAPSAKAYRRVAQPPVEPTPRYSSSVPRQIQEILEFQARIPYDIVANQISYSPGKPYVPEPVQRREPEPVQPVRQEEGRAGYATHEQYPEQTGYARPRALGYYAANQRQAQQQQQQQQY